MQIYKYCAKLTKNIITKIYKDYIFLLIKNKNEAVMMITSFFKFIYLYSEDSNLCSVHKSSTITMP